MTRHGQSVRPRHVPGYAEAVAAGLTPPRPLHAPSLLPGPTAHQALVRCGVALVAAAALAAIGFLIAPTNGRGQLTVLGALTVPVTTAAVVGVVVLAVRRFRRILLAELGAGYVTITLHQGMLWSAHRSGLRGPSSVVAWAWDGVWVLAPSGRVVSAPDPDVEPPGFYPSPSTPGRLELWT